MPTSAGDSFFSGLFDLVQPIDDAVVAFFQGVGPDNVFNIIFPFYTWLGDYGQIWIVIALLLMLSRKYRLWGIASLAALVASWLLGEFVLKELFLRERPFIADASIILLIDPPHGTSFPSSHSATSMAFAFCLIRSNLNKIAKIGILALALFMAVSRMYLCVHHMSDVVVGCLIGVAVGLIVGSLAKIAIEKYARNRKPIVLERGKGM